MLKIPASIYYYISFALMPLLGLLQTKVLTTILLPSTFGEIQIVLPVLAWTILIGGLGTPQYIIRFYCRDGIVAYKEGFFISVATIFLVGMIIGTIFIFFKPTFGELKISYRMLLLFLLAALTEQVVALLKALLRVMERHILYNSVAIVAKALLVAGVIMGVIWWFELPTEGYLFGTAVASAILFFGVFLFLRTKDIFKAQIPSTKSISQIVSYGFPIVCIMLMGDLLPNLNRYVIVGALDTGAVAKYAVGCMIAALCFQTLYEPLNTILHPPAFRAWEENNKVQTRQIISRYLNMYIIVGIIVCGLSIRFEDILLSVVANANYRLPAGCFSILIISNFLLGIYRFTSIHYYLERNTFELGLFFFLSIIVTFTAAVFLTGRIGLLGTVSSVLCGVTVLFVAVWFRAKKNLRIKLMLGYHVIALVISLGLVLVPTLSAWNIYSSQRWLDAISSFVISAGSTFILLNVFNKYFKYVTAKYKEG